MADAATATAEFLRLLAMAVLREGEPAILAPRASDALRDVFAKQKSLILDVQFTGFTQKGQLVGRVDPQLLRAAGHLITLRVTRVGFTPDATEDDLAVLFEAVGKTTAELAGESVVAVVSRAAPRGVYLMTSTEVYRPAAPPKPEPAPASTADSAAASVDQVTSGDQATAAEASTEERPAEETPAAGAAAGAAADVTPDGELAPLDEEEGFDLSAFELVEDVPVLGSASAPASAPAPAAAGSTGEPGGGEVGSNDMFHFFRAVQSGRHDQEAEQLPRLLHEAENVTRFDELAQSTVREALRLARSDHHEQAVELLHVLVREAQRPDRTRLFRESAAGALQRVSTGEPLQLLADLLQHAGPERERILDLFLFLGGDAVALLETTLFRTPDAGLRHEIFVRLLRVEGMSARLMTRAMGDPAPQRTRLMLELAALPAVDADISLRWVTEAAGHADPTVRADAARHASTLGGRGGLRLLLDLLNDRDPAVKRAAAQGLGILGDAAAVPFLSRLLSDAPDEEVQLATIATLGKIGSAEGLPALVAVVNRRSLFGAKKMVRVKAAALAAIGRISTPAAREFLQSVAAGKDADLAPEARRALTTIE